MSAIPTPSHHPHASPPSPPASAHARDEATTTPASSGLSAGQPPVHPRPSPVRLYTTQYIVRDRVEHIIIPHGCVGVIETPRGFGSPLFAGKHSTEMLALRGLNAFWLHTVWNRPTPLYLDVRGRSHDGWPLGFTLQVIVEVTDPVELVQAPNPEQNLRGSLISAALQVVGRYTACELNGASPEIHLSTLLQAIRQLYAEEMQQGLAAPGLALRRLDLIRPWTDAGLTEHLRKLALQGRLDNPASPMPNPVSSTAPIEPVETVEDALDRSPPASNAPATTPVVPDLAGPLKPKQSPVGIDPLERATVLVEKVVRGLVRDGHLRLPNKRRDAILPGETLDQAAISHLRALVAHEFTLEPIIEGEEDAHG